MNCLLYYINQNFGNGVTNLSGMMTIYQRSPMANILIVEDEQSISDLILMNLEMVGYTAIQAFDSNEALAAIKSHHFDLCLLDIMLPGLDGFQLIDSFKKLSIPVIFLTAKGSLTDRVKGLNLGAEDYITTKPFYRVDKSRSRKTGGAGLGLSISKNIASLHHADMIIQSQEGLGTTIQIIFYNSVTTS